MASMTKEAEDVMEFVNKAQGLPPGLKTKLLMSKVHDVDEDHKKSEKTLRLRH